MEGWILAALVCGAATVILIACLRVSARSDEQATAMYEEFCEKKARQREDEAGK